MFICVIFATKSPQRVCTERVASPSVAFLGAARAPNFLVTPELRARAGLTPNYSDYRTHDYSLDKR
jgi:hypothetical protein